MKDTTIGALIAAGPKLFCQDCGISLTGRDPRIKRCGSCKREYQLTKMRRRFKERLKTDPEFRAENTAKCKSWRQERKKKLQNQ